MRSEGVSDRSHGYRQPEGTGSHPYRLRDLWWTSAYPGTRVRVSDILDLLAHGVPQSDILADYPYLNEADLRAALAFGAAASAHRVILAA